MGKIVEESARRRVSSPAAAHTIGARIRAHRAALGMNQDELARACWVSRPTISNWELGKTVPSAEDVALLATAFDITADDLLQGIAPAGTRASADRRELHVLFCVWWAAIALGIVCVTAWSAAGYPLASWQFAAAIGSVAAMIAPLARAHVIARRHGLKTDWELVAYALGNAPAEKPADIPAWQRFVRRHGTAFGIGTGIVLYPLLDYLIQGPAENLVVRIVVGALAICIEAVLLYALCRE